MQDIYADKSDAVKDGYNRWMSGRIVLSRTLFTLKRRSFGKLTIIYFYLMQLTSLNC